MKLVKNLNYTLLVNGFFLVLLLVWALVMVLLFSDFGRYQLLKKADSHGIEPDRIEEGIPARESFSSDFGELVLFDIFSQGKKKRSTVSDQANSGGNARYKVLGVVKMDQLYAVVEIKGAPGPVLFAEKSSYDNDFLVEEVQPYQVIIRDRLGILHVHNVFRYEDVKRESVENVIRLFESDYQSTEERDNPNQRRIH
jgi:hypothetical protein